MPPSSTPESASPQIVLVEDDVALSKALAFSLGLEGFDVRTHRSASTVSMAGLPNRGCLVIDYVLPGENGLNLVARLRGEGLELPTILITSHANALMRKQADDLGTVIIEKPLLGEGLVSAIRTGMALA